MRQELVNYYLALIHDQKFKDILEEINLTVNDNIYQEWYSGFTDLKLPTRVIKVVGGSVPWYRYSTVSHYGNISSRYFGKNFNISTIKEEVVYSLDFYFKKVPVNRSLNFHLHINKESMLLRHPSFDRVKIFKYGYIQNDLKRFSLRIPIDGKVKECRVSFERQADRKDLNYLGK